jgi:predicted GNAT superfamily acetyltransferase
MHAVFAALWGEGGVPQVNVFRAIQHAGGYLAVAEVDSTVVAGSLGFLGRASDGEALLHSHITGVAPGHADRGIGYALKQHQREWCLSRGIERIEWTFDPLVRRNAHFNLNKLGATATAYHADFYGPMDDAINAGDESDRLVATWRLLDPPRGGDTDGPVVLDIGEDGSPVVRRGTGQLLRFRIPATVRDDQRRAWRHAVRETLGSAIADGYIAVTMTADGCYVVSR